MFAIAIAIRIHTIERNRNRNRKNNRVINCRCEWTFRLHITKLLRRWLSLISLSQVYVCSRIQKWRIVQFINLIEMREI